MTAQIELLAHTVKDEQSYNGKWEEIAPPIP